MAAQLFFITPLTDALNSVKIAVYNILQTMMEKSNREGYHREPSVLG